MGNRVDTLATEQNLTFEQVCKILAKKGIDFKVNPTINPERPTIRISCAWSGMFNVTKNILDEEMISYSTGEDTAGFFILILARNV